MATPALILVVDDEVDILETYAILFELHGYEVRTASDGVEALTLLERQTPDLIISDCMMPLMDGVEFTRRVRARPATATTPIILMSGAPELHDMSRALHTVFLRKPLMFDALMVEVQRLLPA